jgi:phosphoribosylformylglycinamidine cyclo-ligase
LVQGAEPLFFLDYIAVDKVDSQKVANIVKGVADACKESGCALIGGETAEMAGFYSKGEYDIAGFCVGVVDKSKMITGEKVKPGDVLLGLPSSGVHSNGFSLVRKICFEAMGYDMNTEIPEFGCTLGEKLLTPTRLYPKSCLPLIEKFDIHGMVHITGGGFYENVPRILPENCDAEVNAESWEVPVVFKKLQEWGNVPWKEMYRTFNMGVGMVLVIDAAEADAVREHLRAAGEEFFELGKVVEGNKQTIMKGGVFGE